MLGAHRQLRLQQPAACVPCAPSQLKLRDSTRLDSTHLSSESVSIGAAIDSSCCAAPPQTTRAARPAAMRASLLVRSAQSRALTCEKCVVAAAQEVFTVLSNKYFVSEESSGVKWSRVEAKQLLGNKRTLASERSQLSHGNRNRSVIIFSRTTERA